MTEQEQNGQGAPAGQPDAGAHEHEELQKLMEFVQANGTLLTVILAVVAVMVFGSSLYKRHQEKRRAEASAMLFSVDTVQDLDNLVSRYGSTPVAALGLLKLAKSYYDGGSYDMAINTYDEFKEKYADHPLASAAELGTIHCAEAMGQTEEALASYAAFSETRTNDFLAAQAVFGEARCQEALKRYSEAKTLYEDFLAENPDGPWTMQAEEALQLVKRRLDEKPTTVQAAPLPADGDSVATPTPDISTNAAPAEIATNAAPAVADGGTNAVSVLDPGTNAPSAAAAAE